MRPNESVTYRYTGKCQKVTLEPGVYRIDCYGAKGGGSTGGGGNKTSGYYKVTKTTDVFVWCGQAATSGTGGWNGGQTVTESGVYGGGGGTDVSLQGTDGSTNWNNTTHLNSRIIAAMGGGGQGKTGGATTGTATSTRIDARTEYVNRAGVQAGYIIPKASGQLIFQSTSYSHDPYGFIDNASGGNIASNDDSGRPYTGNSWDFRIVLNVTAGTKYVFRIGSYASSLGTTGWANWFATYPNSEAVLYTVITSGGKGGGSDYFASSMLSTSKSANANSGNGYVVFTYYGNQISTVNCTADKSTVKYGDTVTITVPRSKTSSGYKQISTGDFTSSYNKLSFSKKNATQYTFVVPVSVIQDLGINGTITITATFSTIKTIRCTANTSRYDNGEDVVTIEIEKLKMIDGYMQSFVGLENDYGLTLLRETDTSFIFTVPDALNGETITIEAMYTKMRVNSNFYKDALYHEPFDFNKIVGDL